MATSLLVILLVGAALGKSEIPNEELPDGDIKYMTEYHRLSRLRHSPEEFFSYYQNITLYDLVPDKRLPTAQDLQCYSEFAQLTAGLSSGSLWAYKRILMGHLKDLDHYEECVRIDHAIGSSFNIQCKYCIAQLPRIAWLLGLSWVGLANSFLASRLRQPLSKRLHLVSLRSEPQCGTYSREHLLFRLRCDAAFLAGL